ncbi:Signal recognition particle receptor subunit beta, a GTPase [Thermomonospora echinospora]|uniref:Signal recognition particle receptor subunit beta, a GTPase n=1 Tax=Thermomonospora echinospora TaxID=1992 RepID=A0A1H6DRK5_9ACTN|nr:ATP/GTP-binding protein [Thermomonospora echinospora]SEG88007.1 Signal recognition particle receptor subunit beta, a GTPase [Thermomonospora echinospora]
MVSNSSDTHPPAPAPARPAYIDDTVEQSVKLLVAGSLGVGKTTFISRLSEIPPLCTEALMTTLGKGTDRLDGLDHKSTTTVAMDFGRITLTPRKAPPLALYLFGTPGQQRFWNVWEGYGLAAGAAGALVLVDTRRLDDSFEVLDQLETRAPHLPTVVAVNLFPDSADHDLGTVHSKLDLPAHTPVTTCVAIDRDSAKQALIALVRHALDLTAEGRTP